MPPHPPLCGPPSPQGEGKENREPAGSRTSCPLKREDRIGKIISEKNRGCEERGGQPHISSQPLFIFDRRKTLSIFIDIVFSISGNR